MHLVGHLEPILHKKCRLVEKIDRELKDIVHNMIFTMHANEGVGLAANQVGIDMQLFVSRVWPSVVLNPTILKQKGSKFCEEGCLSLPKQKYHVRRPRKIKLHGYNISGREFTREYTGFLAEIISHEVDHLNGITLREVGELQK